MALLTDNAKELYGNLMQQVCRLLGIDKQHTTFYHPETNSIAERLHGTLNSMTGKVVDEDQRNWDLCLPYIMTAYRATVHQSTSYSPNYLMLGREVRAPADLVYGLPTDYRPTSYDAYTCEVEERMRSAYAIVREHLGRAAERSEELV